MPSVPEKIASRCVCCGSARLERSPAILMPFVANRAFGWTPVEITADWGLRTIKTGMAYPLCNSLQCQDCGLVFLDIRFSDAEMAALYADYRGEAYAAQRDRFEPGYIAHNAAILQAVRDTSWMEGFLTPHLPTAPRVLDWGGDTGANAPFRGAGRPVDVFDISQRPMIEGARRIGAEELRPGAYDLIVLSHVLEHAPQPATVIAEARAVMDRDAILYVETPFETLIAEAPRARNLAASKKHWHEHINFFTEDALRTLLSRSGLEVVAWQVRTLPSHANFTQAIAAACRLADG